MPRVRPVLAVSRARRVSPETPSSMDFSPRSSDGLHGNIATSRKPSRDCAKTSNRRAPSKKAASAPLRKLTSGWPRCCVTRILRRLKHHQQCERELNERIAAASPPEAARLAAAREELREAGLWRPTIPGPRDAMAILRYEGRLQRMIGQAVSTLDAMCMEASRTSGLSAARRTSEATIRERENAKTKPTASIREQWS